MSGLLRPAWRRLLSGQPHLAWEYTWTSDGVQINLWVPGTVPPGLIERAVQSAWPGATTHASPATPPLPATIKTNVLAAGGQLRLARPAALPLNIDHDTDPLRALFGANTGLRAGEAACVQVLARPATGHRLRHLRHTLTQLRTGRSASMSGRLLDLADPTSWRKAASTDAGGSTGSDPVRAAEVRAGVAKTAGPCFEVLTRYALAVQHPAGPNPAGRLRGRAHTLASAFAVYSGRNWLARKRLRRPIATLAERQLVRGDLLSVPELAALAHLPTDAAVPGMARAGARAVAPSPAVPAGGERVKVLGDSDTGVIRPVGLPVADARHHLHVMGATGSGKSTLLAQLICADVAAGRGVVVIDPKGDLVVDLLDRLPRRCAGRLVVFDPDDPAPPPVLNVLQSADPGELDVTVDNLVGVFGRIFAASWGPRTDDLLRSACLTLLRHTHTRPGTATLAHIPRLLAEPAFRHRYTTGITDPVLAGFWTWYDSLTDAARGYVTGPVMNKLRAFLLRGFVRQAIAAGPSTFDPSQILDGGVLLVRLPKGVLGEETARLLGSLIVARTWQAATRRTRQPEAARRDAALYVDEFQNFLTLPYPMADMLAEARALRLSLVLAHQDLAQLPRDLAEGVSANARNKIYFAASPEDARVLARHTQPHLTETDLARLAAYQAAARLVIGSGVTSAFTFRTRPLPDPIPGRARLLRHAARSRYGNHHPTRPASPASLAGGRIASDPRMPASPTKPAKRGDHTP
ncbi:MAG: type IV secretory system conjugative DNA transfer family protein [Mycobacteriales bacterium]